MAKVSERGRTGRLGRVLVALGNALAAHARHPLYTRGFAYKILREFRELQDMSDRQLRAISHYMLEKKYITVKREGRHATIELTEKGRRKRGKAALQQLAPKKQAVWDGKMRVVIFDVPDEKKAARDAFAAILKRFDFKRLQKSVFASPYPCEEELEIVADYYDITDCVEVLVAEKMTRRERIISLFKLTAR